MKNEVSRPDRSPAASRDRHAFREAEMPAYRLVRSRRRTMALVVTAAGELEVRAPLRATVTDIHRMIDRYREWIARKQSEQQKRSPIVLRFEEGAAVLIEGRHRTIAFGRVGRERLRLADDSIILARSLEGREDDCRHAVIGLLRQVTRERMEPLAREVASACGLSVREIRVTSAQRRWGSCSSRGSLNFSYRLAQAPPFVQRYLAVHEVAHLRHPNHSRTYWDLVARLMPEYREAERWLKDEGRRLPL